MRTYPITLNKGEKGPSTVILAGVHGNEHCGISAIEKVIPILERTNLKGRITFDIGNPKAVHENKRFIDVNLNRMLRSDELLSKKEKASYEYGRSRELMSLLDESDALLDIHSSKNPVARQFIICEEKSLNIARHLPFDLVTYNFDQFEPGGTDGYMKNKIGICVECGQHLEPDAAILAEKSILAFLTAMGQIEGPYYNKEQSLMKVFHIYKNKNEFVLLKTFEDFEEIEKDLVIGKDGETEIISPENCKIIFAHPRKEPGEECFLLGKMI